MLKPEFVEITESFAEVPSKRKREYVDKDNGCERVEKNLWCLQKRQSCNINRGGLTKTSYKNGRAATSIEGNYRKNNIKRQSYNIKRGESTQTSYKTAELQHQQGGIHENII